MKIFILVLQFYFWILFSNGEEILPSISFKDLKSSSDFSETSSISAENFKDSGHKIGAFVVSQMDDSYQKAVENFYKNAPDCLKKHSDKLPNLKMNDGSFRTTFANQIGQEENFHLECLDSEIKTISEYFDTVDNFVTRIIESVAGGPVTYHSENRNYRLKDSPTKSHVHVYTHDDNEIFSNKDEDNDIINQTDDSSMLVPYHIDNGLYLIITPFPDQGLKIKTSSGQEIVTDLPSNSILILMGRALTDWLLVDQPVSRNQFFPVPHGVDALDKNINARSIFARMKIAPLEAVVENDSNQIQMTFEDIFYNKEWRGSDTLCASELYDDKIIVKRSITDHFHKAMDDSCQEGTAFCWMACRPLANNGTCGYGDMMVCWSDEKNITCGTSQDHPEPMDPTCKWQCVPEPKPNPNTFCNGGMDMLMGGFATTKGAETCVILFFHAWTLDTPAKFALACIGVFILGFTIEIMIAVRRTVTSRRGFIIRLTPMARRFVVVSLFGLNLILGYLAMLVAMTYSIELFLCVVFGLCVGHFTFNTKSVVGESIDPCCASQNDNQHQLLNGTSNHHGGHGSTRLTRTPCDLEGQVDSDEELIDQQQQAGPSVQIVQSSSSNLVDKKCCPCPETNKNCDTDQCPEMSRSPNENPPPYSTTEQCCEKM